MTTRTASVVPAELSIALGITTQHPQHIGQLAEVAEGVPGIRRIHAVQEIQIKKIFPRFSAKGTGFNFLQINIPQREGAQGAEQGARRVARSEYERSFPAR